MKFELTIAFLFGLQASLHCIGMCGPLALAAPINRTTKKNILFGSISYNLGRIVTYSYIGFIVGLFGIGEIFLQGIQIISIISGSIIIISAFYSSMETWPYLRILTAKMGVLSSRLFPEIKKTPIHFRPFLFGLVNGLLPCGMVYMALLLALSNTNALGVSLAMAFFGIGTLPIMFFIPLMGQKRIYKMLPVSLQRLLLIIIGTLLVLRGLGLGIPYISPEMTKPLNPNAQPSVECCHTQQ
jgi:sulfite exporter TauE/SafE